MLKTFYLCWIFLTNGNIATMNCSAIDGLDDPAIVPMMAGNPNGAFKIYEFTIAIGGASVREHDVTMRPPPTVGPRGKKIGQGPIEVPLPSPMK